jgi:hypothetical protein
VSVGHTLLVVWLALWLPAYVGLIAWEGQEARSGDPGDRFSELVWSLCWPLWVLTIPYWTGIGLGKLVRYVRSLEW